MNCCRLRCVQAITGWHRGWRGLAERGGGTLTSASPRVEITLLGGFRVAVAGTAVPERAWRQRRAAAVVKLLALAPGRYLHREQIFDTLWPELDLEAAANNLRVALHHARRQVVAVAGGAAPAFLIREGEGLSLGPEEQVRVDLDQFEAAVARVWRTEDFAHAGDALNLYAGELLPDDPYEDWVADRRAVVLTSYVTLLSRQAAWYEAAGRLDQAVVARQRQVAVEPLDEVARVQLIRLLATTGRPRQALEQYELLVDLLARELATEPEPATVALGDAIRSGQFAALPTPAPASHPEPTRPAAAPLRIARRPPAPVDELVGRGREVAELQHLMRTRRLVTLTGPGGAGKTRLALAAARAAAAAFPAGVAFVDLAPLTEPGLVLPAVAQALGVREVGDEPLADIVAVAVGEARLLVVVDNLEHLLAATPVITALLAACPGLCLLLTSRIRLRLQGEQSYPVAPLALPAPTMEIGHGGVTFDALRQVPSVALFERRAQLADPDFGLTVANAGAVIEICRRVDGLPLALEMAAARVRLLPPDELARRLAQPLAVLGGARDAPARQRTLRATIAWSQDLLTPEERRVFAEFAVFAGGAGLDAVEAVSGAGGAVDAALVLETAAALVDHSLVQQAADGQGQARLRMLATIREFAQEHLAARPDADAVRLRHAAHYLTLAETAAPALTGPDQATWLDRLEQEHDNLRAALRTSEQLGPPGALPRLAAALWRFWWVRGFLSEGRGWLERAATASPDPPDRTTAAVLDGAGVLAEAQGDLTAAVQRHEAALAIADELRDRPGQMRALVNLGLVADERGDFDLAIRRYQAALAIARELDDAAGVASCLANIGFAALEQGRHATAADHFRQSLHLFRHVGDQRNLGAVLDSLGVLAFREGDLARAAALQAEALTLLRAVGDRQGVADALANAGHTTQRLGDMNGAERHYADALALYRELGDQSGVAFALTHLGRLAAELGDPGRAGALLREALDLAWTLGERVMIAEAMEGLATVALARGEPAQTARLLGAAGALRQEIAVPLPAVHAGEHQRCLDAARAVLGAAAFEAALNEGRNLLPNGARLAPGGGE